MTPVRWGFLGAGAIARRQVGVLAAADGAELAAVAARDPKRAAELGAPRVHASYDALLADPEIDAVYVALNNDAHRPWSEAALRAGKTVLCEKPLALSAAEVDEMAAVAAQTGQALVEASWYQWHPRVRLAADLLSRGEIGPVRHVSAGFTFAGVPPDNYRLVPHMGGGALYDVGCYAISAALWSVGSTGSGAIEVSANTTLGETGVDLAAEVILTWPGGATAQVRAGMAESEKQWLVISGERGELELRDAPFTAWFAQDTQLLVSDGSTTRRIDVPAADAYKTMFENVSSLVRGEPAWVVPLANSRATAAVLDACFASAAKGGGPVTAEEVR